MQHIPDLKIDFDCEKCGFFCEDVIPSNITHLSDNKEQKTKIYKMTIMCKNCGSTFFGESEIPEDVKTI